MRPWVSKGFTLVEMLVVAPIVILSIGAFIALIVNLTGEVMSSRGSNAMAYNVQDALNRIEQDVKLSTGFLAFNTIPFDSTNQAQSYDGTTALFENTGNGTSGPILILNGLVTNGNPTSLGTSNVYLKDQPNDCSDSSVYSKNRPMTLNIVYFVKNNTLWRRTVMPSNYDDPAIRCGNAPWQQPSCSYGYSSTFCKTNDVSLIDNFSSIDFSLQYFTTASGVSPIAGVTNASTDDATRATSLQSATTVMVGLTVNKTIAGRDISRAGTLRASRLDTNATSVTTPSLPTDAPAIPVVAGAVSDGHKVTFTWPQVSTATAYDLQYRVNGGTWTAVTDLSNSARSYAITSATHTDVVEAQVRSKNVCATGICASNYSASTSITIPLWAPLVLQNNWTRYSASYSTAAYTKTRAGVVVLKGMIKNGNFDTTTASLPADYRPSGNLMFETSTGGSGAPCRFDVFASGDVSVTSVCLNGWASIDNVHFLAADAPTLMSGTLAPQNSWVNFTVPYPGSGWANASYGVDIYGRVHTRGLVANGTNTDGTVIVSLPAGLGPNGYMHVVNLSSNANSQIGINTAGQLLAKGGPTSYQSLLAMYQPATCPSGATCPTWTALPLVSPWAQYGGYSTAQYTKSADNIVMVKGLVQGGSSGTTIANLPAGFCPKERLLLTAEAVGGWGRIDIIPGAPGTSCQVYGYNVLSAWTSLDAISFIAEQ